MRGHLLSGHAMIVTVRPVSKKRMMLSVTVGAITDALKLRVLDGTNEK